MTRIEKEAVDKLMTRLANQSTLTRFAARDGWKGEGSVSIGGEETAFPEV